MQSTCYTQGQEDQIRLCQKAYKRVKLTCARMMGTSQCKQIMNQKHTAKATGELLKVKKWDNLRWHALQILNTYLNGERSTASN